jgi:hypothetical protein
MRPSCLGLEEQAEKRKEIKNRMGEPECPLDGVTSKKEELSRELGSRVSKRNRQHHVSKDGRDVVCILLIQDS